MFVFLSVMYKLELMAVCWIITRHTHNHNYLNCHMHRAVGACKRSQCCRLVQMMFTVPEEVPVRCYLSHKVVTLMVTQLQTNNKSCTIEKLFYSTKEKGCIFSDCRFFLRMLLA